MFFLFFFYDGNDDDHHKYDSADMKLEDPRYPNMFASFFFFF